MHRSYYVSAPLQRGRGRSDDRAIRRVPAVALEGLLSRTLRRLVPIASDQPLDLPIRVEIHAQSLQLLLPIHHLPTVRGHLTDGEQVEVDPADATALRLTLPIRFKVRGGKTEVIGGQQPKTRRDPNLIKALRSAHALLTSGIKGLPTLETSPASTYQRRLIRLAFLAPDLQRAILDGRQPPGLTLSRIMEGEVPLSWSEQQKTIGTPIQN